MQQICMDCYAEVTCSSSPLTNRHWSTTLYIGTTVYMVLCTQDTNETGGYTEEAQMFTLSAAMHLQGSYDECAIVYSPGYVAVSNAEITVVPVEGWICFDLICC